MFVRHLSTFLPSRWAQDCRRRDSQTLTSYLQRVQDPNLDHPDYRPDQVLSRFVALRDSELIALSYDNAVRRDGSVVPGFLRLLGLDDASIAEIASEPYASVNARANWSTTELSRLLNGALASHRGLEQDALFSARLHLGSPTHFFDLEQHIMGGVTDLAEPLLRVIEESGHDVDIESHVDADSSTRRVLDIHGGRFTNLERGTVLPLPAPSVRCTFLEWPHFNRAFHPQILAILQRIS